MKSGGKRGSPRHDDTAEFQLERKKTVKIEFCNKG
jgi:hypothetical protein